MRTLLLMLVLIGALALLHGEAAAMADSGYVLSAPAWRVSGVARGGDFQLASAKADAEETCCCVYIPCVLNK